MQLPFDVRGKADSLHTLDVARAGPEPDAIEHVHDRSIVRALRDGVPVLVRHDPGTEHDAGGDDRDEKLAGSAVTHVLHLPH